MADLQQQLQEEAERLLSEITPGQWCISDFDGAIVSYQDGDAYPERVAEAMHGRDDEFISEAPRLVRQLLTALRSVERPQQVQAVTALEFAYGAILDAIELEDGLDGAAGSRVLQMIRAALLANGKQPPPIPGEDEEVPITPAATVSIEPTGVRVSEDLAPGLCTTSGEPVEKVRAAQTNETGQHEAYIVLCPDERAKGFVRPYRDAYRHVGPPAPHHELRDLTEDERRMFGDHFAKFEHCAPPGSSLAAEGRFWTQAELDAANKGCGSVTTMGRALSETYARNPKFYGATFCVTCNRHLPVAEFVWTADGERVGS